MNTYVVAYCSLHTGTLFMRYIRKHLEANEDGRKASS